MWDKVEYDVMNATMVKQGVQGSLDDQEAY
jgi:hypothetical protein